MKRFNLFIKKLSLSQQMFALIFFFITFFAAFFFVYLNGNIDIVIKDQMFQTLERTQNTIIASLKSQVTMDQLNTSFQDTSITHVFFSNYNGTSMTTNPKYLKGNEEMIQEMYTNSMKMPGETQEFVYDKDPKVYYRIIKVDDSLTLVSMVGSEYLEKFKNTLVSSIINITVIVVGFFFIIMMLWVASLIHPLNQMRNYIEKVKIGKEAEMRVNRKDEIGELADALVSMRNELQKQEKTKEDMIHNISHDLKTPIATIKSYGESIKDGIYPYDTLEKSVDVIIENADRLEKKVHSLLYMNRVEYLISQDSEGAKTNMKDVVEKVILNIKVINPNINITTSLDDIFFDGLEEPWRVTVENIVENALRYAKSTIHIELSEAEGLTIYNDGPCLSEDRIKVLFRPFEKGQDGKFGLGLSIVSKVVRANNYDVSGENTSDGVIFRINKSGLL